MFRRGSWGANLNKLSGALAEFHGADGRAPAAGLPISSAGAMHAPRRSEQPPEPPPLDCDLALRVSDPEFFSSCVTLVLSY